MPSGYSVVAIVPILILILIAYAVVRAIVGLARYLRRRSDEQRLLRLEVGKIGSELELLRKKQGN